MKPFFSVIIPLFNKEDYIAKTIKSALNQSFKDFEIIVVNDGSTDKSEIILKSCKSDKIKVFTIKNQGVSYARNYAINKSNAKYVALLDADDLWNENHLFELKKQINLFPDAGLYCNNYYKYFSKNIKRKTVFNFKYTKDCLIVHDYFKGSIIDSIAWTSAVAFSKEIFLAVGGFDTSLINGQDTDLWIKFALKYPVSFNPNRTANYMQYIEHSLSQNEYNFIRYKLVNKFKEEEKTNTSLKMYLDVNRYSVAIRSKIYNQKDIYNKLKKEMDYNNLNIKQKFLIKSPRFLLQLYKIFQRFLIKNNIYTSAYS